VRLARGFWRANRTIAVDFPTPPGYSQAVATRSRGLTYRGAGVDIDAADRLVARIARIARNTQGPEVLSGVGLFAAASKLPRGLREPVLLTAADGVGTKLAVARLAGKHDTVGIDLVAMNVNDLLTSGARPLCFLDYLSVGRLASVDAVAVIRGIAEGCRRAGASLVGGETAEMPGFYADGDYDLAGFAVGVAERRRLVTGKAIKAGMALVGLESNGLHSNGFSLARRALRIDSKRALVRRPRGLGRSLGEELLRPTRIYVRPVLAALERFPIAGMAHITGGGIPGNLVRILPAGITAVVDRGRLPRVRVLDLIAGDGGVGVEEMDRTFNAGLGFVIAVRAKAAEELCSFLRRRKVPARIVGRTIKGQRGVEYEEGP
jgi:phosphoribosylformylglycinamidine cyclo-ligase